MVISLNDRNYPTSPQEGDTTLSRELQQETGTVSVKSAGLSVELP